MGKRANKKAGKKAGKKAAKKGTKVWSLFSLWSALLGAAAAKKALDAGWKVATGNPPPKNPSDPDVKTREAVTWAVTSGTVVGLAKVLATRKAASYYAASTGTNPPKPKLPKK
jgi:hypothetical protein